MNLIKKEYAGDYEIKAVNTMGDVVAKSHVSVLSKFKKKLLGLFLQQNYDYTRRIRKARILLSPLFNLIFRTYRLN